MFHSFLTLLKLQVQQKHPRNTNSLSIDVILTITEMQVENMVENHHIYMPSNGRINISGINLSNVKLVAEAIHDSVLTFPATDEYE